MNVLFVIHTPRDEHTAVYGLCADLVRSLEADGHRATILTPNDFPSLARHWRWLPLTYPFAVWRWLRRRRGGYDLAVFHSYAGWVANATRAPNSRPATITAFHGLEPFHYHVLKAEARRGGKPLTLRFRMLHGVALPRLMRWSCGKSDLVLCLNQTEAEYLIRHRWGSGQTVRAMPHGVPRTFFISRRYEARPRRLLFVGQWVPRKGIGDIVPAFTALARQNPELELLCAGTLASEHVVRASFPEDVRARVVVCSKAPRHELAAIYGAADIFVFPSLFEGFSLALLEAMASGLPIVTTAVGAAPELLKTAESALFVPTGNPDMLAHAVGRLLDDGVLRAKLGRQARVVAERYDLERVHADMLALFEQTVQRRRVSADPRTAAAEVRH